MTVTQRKPQHLPDEIQSLYTIIDAICTYLLIIYVSTFQL